MTDTVQVELSRVDADALLNGAALDTGYHHARVNMRQALRVALDAPGDCPPPDPVPCTPRYTMAEIEEELQCQRWIAHHAREEHAAEEDNNTTLVKEHRSAREVFQDIADGLGALTREGGNAPPESLSERVERLEAELADAEKAAERKRQEDGP